jgi:hypothetical protein
MAALPFALLVPAFAYGQIGHAHNSCFENKDLAGNEIPRQAGASCQSK